MRNCERCPGFGSATQTARTDWVALGLPIRGRRLAPKSEGARSLASVMVGLTFRLSQSQDGL